MDKDNALFFNDAETNDLIWIGENHGIKENYDAYRYLIPKLIEKGFTDIFLELPKKPNENDGFSIKDGRFSKEAIEFVNWLDSLAGINIKYFDTREKSQTQQESEDALARSLINQQDGKTIVISGNFHSQINFQKINDKDVLPAAGIVNKLTGKKILVVGLKYAGGLMFSHGMKEISKLEMAFDKDNLPFGSIMENRNKIRDEKWWFSVGEASPVTIF